MSKKDIQLRWLKAGDSDLAEIVEELNTGERWGEYEDTFSVESLRTYLDDKKRHYLLAYIGNEIAGASHAYLMQHPAGPKYFYIDEVDTSIKFRRRGVARDMMKALIQRSFEMGADEAWLGTEDDNLAAKALYESLAPSEVEHGPLYMYKAKDNKPGWR